MIPLLGVLFVTSLVPQPATDRPKEAEYLTARADVHRTHRRFDEAITVYRQALTLGPGYAPAYRGLGRVFDLLGRHADARAQYTAGLQRANEFEDEPLLWDLAASFVFDRRFDDANAALQRWVELSLKRRGQDASGSTMFFDLAMAREDFDEAERVLQRHYTQLAKPLDAPAADKDVILGRIVRVRYQGQRAVLAARRGRSEQARSLMAEAQAELSRINALILEKAPGPAPSSPPQANPYTEQILPMGEIAFWLGDMTLAIELLSAEYVKLPRHDLLLGQAYERERNLEAARAAYTRLVESAILSIELAWARPIAQARLAAIGR